MAKGSNGTIKINSQTVNQRAQFAQTFGANFGVATDRLTSMFPDSPIVPSGDDAELYRSTDNNPVEDDDSVLEGAADIYLAYANVIDPSEDSATATAGFGFTADNNNGAFLNYRHPNNPFITNNGEGGVVADYDSLTSGGTYTDRKAYKGFPDLSVNHDFNTPSDASPESGLGKVEGDQDPAVFGSDALTGDGASFGHETAEYRRQIAINGAFGYHLNAGEGNGSNDTLGSYFRNKNE
tara:strand:- start:5062 stop:5775 length:714 start_codon:yes stop_codon:yes gene_type:complete